MIRDGGTIGAEEGRRGGLKGCVVCKGREGRCVGRIARGVEEKVEAGKGQVAITRDQEVGRMRWLSVECLSVG